MCLTISACTSSIVLEESIYRATGSGPKLVSQIEFNGRPTQARTWPLTSTTFSFFL